MPARGQSAIMHITENDLAGPSLALYLNHGFVYCWPFTDWFSRFMTLSLEDKPVGGKKRCLK